MHGARFTPKRNDGELEAFAEKSHATASAARRYTYSKALSTGRPQKLSGTGTPRSQSAVAAVS